MTQHVVLFNPLLHPFCQHAAVLVPCPPAGVQCSLGTLQTNPEFKAYRGLIPFPPQSPGG